MVPDHVAAKKDPSTGTCEVRIVGAVASSCISSKPSTNRHKRPLAAAYTSGVISTDMVARTAEEVKTAEGSGNGVSLYGTT